MKLLNIDQFLVDPIINPKEEILVESGWLQEQLRRLHEVERLLKLEQEAKDQVLGSNAYLRGQMTLLESKQPFNRLVVHA